MMLSWRDRWARNLVIRFLNDFITSGCLIFLEKDGTVLTFGDTPQESSLKVSLKIHNPQFYWKVATEADLGFADAYINGDISFLDPNEGLLNFFVIYISSEEKRKASLPNSSFSLRNWHCTPLFLSAGLTYAKSFFKYVFNKNTLTEAHRNVSHHYDLSNDLFTQFMDETVAYSCAIFKSVDEDLKTAQLRKISSFIEKAKISKEHHVLEIGCGWGTLAIEAVKRTGCQYTGITLSTEQLAYAEQKVKEAGLQDRVKLMLCDYRHLPETIKYDRIIACEMVEHVGDVFLEKFFSCCDSALAENGILVLQFSSVPDQRYEDFRKCPSFIREYMFPGGIMLSLNRVVTAMTSASKLCVEHVENIGFHYYPTLKNWRKNFVESKREILDLGFDEKFIRTFEYYFDYTAAGFKTGIIGNYQVVFSRPCNASFLAI
ncbi:OLC1v1019605C2 [Oldenlandia corymbosa var. corymbosa]|uniref:OLC1v1019605C2 n=1 Tax=Oldenlandia corymbosa var. corymbosa TaxID=529605 RepID=A0AAV1EEA8_OLDCO|nr:OLC1v1019605C2 [Oldenlandia corymbosa var. corymbosa]